MGIGDRLASTTLGLEAALSSDAVGQQRAAGTSTARTAPGQMLEIHSSLAAMNSELEDLKHRLKDFDGSLVARHFDPRNIKATRWGNRHEASFSTQAFRALKESIELSGGNTQPILVRKCASEQYEIVFGHRRHRACLELGLPVFAVVASDALGDLEVFLSMERENRARADLSPYEQGLSYIAALDACLFPSARRLAEAVGVSHTWVRKSMMVAQLPPEVVQLFPSPLAIQPRHAEEIAKEREKNPSEFMRRVEQLRAAAVRLPYGQTLRALMSDGTEVAAKTSIMLAGKDVGNYATTSKGQLIISIKDGWISRDIIPNLIQALVHVLATVETNPDPQGANDMLREA